MSDTLRGFRSGTHRTLVRDAMAVGLRVRDTGLHVVLYPPDGSQPVIVSRTAYDGKHGAASARAALRRGGAPL
jgi:hypothetical protein